MMSTILVFPSSVDASVAFVRDARRFSERVIGASSAENDPHKGFFDAWERLPFIHEATFVQELRDVVARHSIDTVYTPHAPTYLRLTEIQSSVPNLRILGDSPYSTQMDRVTKAHATAQEAQQKLAKISTKAGAIRADFLAALIADAVPVYGECTTDKIIGLCAACADAPPGDLIEIGTFFGKSALVLNRLADHFRLGATIAVDPWDAGISVQHQSPDTIQKLSNVWDWQKVFEGFLLLMQARHAKPFNYIRATSTQAFNKYINSNKIQSAEFGETETAGLISILHLDGNHDENAVAEDCALWSQRIKAGGWIIFDDYEWSQGDGPRKVADRFQREHAKDIATSFVLGGAAFIQLRSNT